MQLVWWAGCDEADFDEGAGRRFLCMGKDKAPDSLQEVVKRGRLVCKKETKRTGWAKWVRLLTPSLQPFFQ
jgi:hypothetical protein